MTRWKYGPLTMNLKQVPPCAGLKLTCLQRKMLLFFRLTRKETQDGGRYMATRKPTIGKKHTISSQLLIMALSQPEVVPITVKPIGICTLLKRMQPVIRDAI